MEKVQAHEVSLLLNKAIDFFWLYLFAKNDKGNVTTAELKKLKQLADKQLNGLIQLGELSEG